MARGSFLPSSRTRLEHGMEPEGSTSAPVARMAKASPAAYSALLHRLCQKPRGEETQMPHRAPVRAMAQQNSRGEPSAGSVSPSCVPASSPMLRDLLQVSSVSPLLLNCAGQFTAGPELVILPKLAHGCVIFSHCRRRRVQVNLLRQY
jgi:hypothetical protein